VAENLDAARTGIIRPVGAVLAEPHDEWIESRRYLGLDVLTRSGAVPATSAESISQSTTPALTALTAPNGPRDQENIYTPLAWARLVGDAVAVGLSMSWWGGWGSLAEASVAVRVRPRAALFGGLPGSKGHVGGLPDSGVQDFRVGGATCVDHRLDGAADCSDECTD